MKRRILLFTGICLAACVISVTALTWSSGAAEAGPAGLEFSILDNGFAASPEPQLLRGLRQAPDMAKLRVATRDRGRFKSRVVLFPTADGSSICYALLGGAPQDPAMSYCYAPNGKGIPELIGGHFKPSALESIVDGTPSVQLFGVAADTVKSVRVEVAGVMRPVAITRNAFYLDLPGVAREELGIAEATLANGAVQRYNLQTGSYE